MPARGHRSGKAKGKTTRKAGLRAETGGKACEFEWSRTAGKAAKPESALPEDARIESKELDNR